MKTANIYSLLTGRWFINEQYGKTLIPYAYNILSGNGLTLLTDDQEPNEESVIVQASKTSSHQKNAANFDQTDNENDYVLLIDLKNPIYKYNQECGPRGSKHKMGIMARYESDPNMKGVVLDVDSGGGQVSGTPEFYDFIKNYSKPVVAYTDGMMCSAAYYIASAANHIIANKRADAIGSIGTMISFIDMTGYYEKQGAKVITEYATKSTDKNKDFEELLKGNPEGYIKNELDPITEDFHTDMKAARPGLDEKVLAGATWPAEAAKKLGLVDEIGTIQTAIAKVFELAKPQKNKSNINNNKMNTENLTQLMAVIGVESLASTDEGVFLNEEQLIAMEQNITDQAAAVQTAEATLQTETDNLSAAIDDSTAVAGAVDTALTEAEVENSENLSTLEGIEALSGLVKEYGSQDGDKSSKVIANANQKIVNENLVGDIDISAAMNN